MKGYTQEAIQEALAKNEADGGVGLEVAISTVSRAIKRRNQQLAKEHSEEALEIKAEQFARMDYLIMEAAQAWERSQAVAVQEKAKGVAERGTTRKAKDALAGIVGADDYDPEEVSGGIYSDDDGEEISSEERAQKIFMAGMEKAKEEIRAQCGDQADGLLALVEQTITKKWQVGDPRFLEVIRGLLADQRKIYGLDAPTKQEVNAHIDYAALSNEQLEAIAKGAGLGGVGTPQTS